MTRPSLLDLTSVLNIEEHDYIRVRFERILAFILFKHQET